MKIKNRDLSQSLLEIVPLLVAAYIIIFSVSIFTPYAQECYAQECYVQNCYVPSPSYADGKSPFDKINVRDLTNTEEEILIENFKSLSAYWKGEAIEEQCKGSVESPYRERNLYSIKAKAETDRFGNVKLKSTFRSDEKNTTHSEIIRLYLVDNKFRFNDDTGYGDVELIEITKSKVRFLKRYVDRFLRREYFVTLSFESNSFSIDTTIYVQGKYSFFTKKNFTVKD
ncbi:MAG: hypothetical protein GY874_23610 [Desulfobacteraceae bacterium]|nr:hypothetical protein [Desulfobacteraceae bacterium]